MPKKGSKKFSNLTRTASQGLRRRAPDSASKAAYVMPEEMERAKALVQAGNAGGDQGAINRAEADVVAFIQLSRTEGILNPTMDDIDALAASTDTVLTQAGNSHPREAEVEKLKLH